MSRRCREPVALLPLFTRRERDANPRPQGGRARPAPGQPWPRAQVPGSGSAAPPDPAALPPALPPAASPPPSPPKPSLKASRRSSHGDSEGRGRSAPGGVGSSSPLPPAHLRLGERGKNRRREPHKWKLSAALTARPSAGNRREERGRRAMTSQPTAAPARRRGEGRVWIRPPEARRRACAMRVREVGCCRERRPGSAALPPRVPGYLPPSSARARSTCCPAKVLSEGC